MNKHDIVWVSGATGAWGEEICRQALQQPIEKLVAFGRGEHRLVDLGRRIDDDRLRCHLGDIRDTETVRRSMTGATVLIHGAALKRIESGVASPMEMASVNVDGTKAVIEAALVSRVRRAVYISSDKACEPTTFYGATKFVAEELWRGANVYSPAPSQPWFVAARFGNVLGSTGSVLSVWRRQLERREPLLVRVARMTRFVLTRQEAVRRLLGVVDELDGRRTLFASELPAARIIDLAHAFAGDDYPVVFSEPLAEEKLHERMVVGGATSETARRLSVVELRALLAEGGLSA